MTIIPVGGYLSVGTFKIKALSLKYGYAKTNPETFTIAAHSNPTMTAISSSFKGGKSFKAFGNGFHTNHP